MATESSAPPQPPPAAPSQPPFTCALHAGDVLGGRYQVKARMGMGGFACLFLGEDLVTGKEVAIKAQVVSLGSASMGVWGGACRITWAAPSRVSHGTPTNQPTTTTHDSRSGRA